ADAAGLTNVTTRELDLESIDEAADAYDAVLCREGLMLTSDPARASAEIARVLRPSGRFALSVWGPRERNPWLGLLLDSAGAVLGVPVPPPGVPGPFSLSDRDRLAAVLAGAGLAEVQVDEASVPRSAGSFEEWWQRTVALAGPLAKMLESLPPETRDAIRQRAEEAVRPFATADGGLEFPGVALVASGRAA
ncbi:MAG TPA: methyltransferase domain-containing protein, partial [Thermoleophilaceae bacterium]